MTNSILVDIMDPLAQAALFKASTSDFLVIYPNQPVADPFVKMLVQPAAKETRYRYEREGRSSVIVGDGSTADEKTFPTIQVMNYFGRAVVVVSCVTADKPYK